MVDAAIKAQDEEIVKLQEKANNYKEDNRFTDEQYQKSKEARDKWRLL